MSGPHQRPGSELHTRCPFPAPEGLGDHPREPSYIAEAIQPCPQAESEAVAAPRGPATFLFTDIVDSTGLWERDAGAMSKALRHHDELLRTSLIAHGGYVFKATGDGFCAAFHDASQAVRAAVCCQHALHLNHSAGVGDLRVRMALITGLAELRDGDYFGVVMNRGARLLELAHGNQVLLCRGTVDLVSAGLISTLDIHEIGPRFIRGVHQPICLYELRVLDSSDNLIGVGRQPAFLRPRGGPVSNDDAGVTDPGPAQPPIWLTFAGTKRQ